MARYYIIFLIVLGTLSFSAAIYQGIAMTGLHTIPHLQGYLGGMFPAFAGIFASMCFSRALNQMSPEE